jgi:DNA-binding MarR family transcriptional regulator
VGVLSTLAESGPVNQIELATTMSIDRTAMVYLLDELDDQALVERVRSMQDRRAFLIHLTPDGRETQHRAAAALAGAADVLLTPLDLAERRQLVDMLAKVAAHWQEVSASQQHPATSQAGPAARSSQPPTRRRKAFSTPVCRSATPDDR